MSASQPFKQRVKRTPETSVMTFWTLLPHCTASSPPGAACGTTLLSLWFFGFGGLLDLWIQFHKKYQFQNLKFYDHITFITAYDEEWKNTRRGVWIEVFKNKSVDTLVFLVHLNLNYFSPPAKLISPLSNEVLIH